MLPRGLHQRGTLPVNRRQSKSKSRTSRETGHLSRQRQYVQGHSYSQIVHH